MNYDQKKDVVMKTLKQTLLATLCLVGVAMVGCDPSTDTENTKQSIKTYTIGSILPLTGTAAVLGQFNRHGMELAVADVNQRWQSKHKKLVISYADSQNTAKEGLMAFQKMVSVDKLPVVMSAMSRVTNALIQPAKDNNVLLLATTVSEAGMTNKYDKLFRLFVRADTDATTLANYAAEDLKFKKIDVLYVKDSFGESFRDVFTSAFSAKGGQVGLQEGYEPATTDFTSVLTRIKGSDAEAVYVLGYEKTMGIIPKKMKELGVKKTILSIGTLGQPYVMEQAGNSLEGAYFTTTTFDPDQPANQSAKIFSEKYRKQYQSSPNYFSAFAYDSVQILAKAIESSQKYDAQSVAKALAQTQNYSGVIGEINMEANRDARFPMIIKTIQAGKIVFPDHQSPNPAQ